MAASAATIPRQEVGPKLPTADLSELHQAGAGHIEKPTCNEEVYLLSQNPTEVERLGYQHEVIKDHMGGRLVLAPMDLAQRGLRIFDSATADGLWLRDLQSCLPNPGTNQNTYTGTDIVPSYFPNQVPPSTTLMVHNITAEYPESMIGYFDLVHQRLALPGCGTYPLRSAVASLVTLVKPGGWIQLLEADHDGPGSQSPALKDTFRLIKELFGKAGVDCEYARRLKGWLLEMGLEKVEELVLDVPLGKSNENTELGQKGAKSVGMATAGLVDYARSVPTSFSNEELNGLAAHVEEELMLSGGVHRIYAVWGQKPPGERIV